MTDRLVCVETREELTAANDALAISTERLSTIGARRAYMRDYMRKRRAAAKEREEPLSREFQALSPTIQSAITLDEIGRNELDFKHEELDLEELCSEAVKSLKRYHYGDIRGIENGLLCQARTLDRIFNAFIRRGCREGTPEYREFEFRIAFRAQTQYRATLGTLAAIKNPARVAIVNQANIANGPQQVNNGPAPSPSDPSRAEKTENQPNKLLEQTHAERLDVGTSGKANGADSQLEAVGAFDRPEVQSR